MLQIIKKIINFFMCNILFKVEFVNKNINDNMNNCVICANHLSFAEPIILFCMNKNICAMSKKELFKNKFLSYIFLKVGMFPIDRGTKDITAIIHSIKVLKNNKLLIFPEGKRLKENEHIEAKKGAIYIAMKANAPILPVKIEKKHRNRVLFTKLTITFKDPIYYDNTKIKDKEYLSSEANKLMDTIYKV
ncbi:MAG: lysophospholipid acyltransferase family protein [Clostridia bacterium]